MHIESPYSSQSYNSLDAGNTEVNNCKQGTTRFFFLSSLQQDHNHSKNKICGKREHKEQGLISYYRMHFVTIDVVSQNVRISYFGFLSNCIPMGTN